MTMGFGDVCGVFLNKGAKREIHTHGFSKDFNKG